MRPKLRALLVVAALLVGGCGRASGDGATGPAVRATAGAQSGVPRSRLVVSAAASLQAAFTAYGKAFTSADVRFSFAGSDALEGQILQGVTPDVFASANTSIPDLLYSRGLVEPPIHFASNELVLATPARDRKVRSLADVARKGVRVAIGSATVPVGAYTRTVLANVPVAESTAILHNVRSEEPDVTGIVGKLTQGAVDAGFLYETDALAAGGRLRVIHLAAALRPVVTYGVAVLKGARHLLQARLFVYGLLEGAGRRALLEAGFGAPTQ